MWPYQKGYQLSEKMTLKRRQFAARQKVNKINFQISLADRTLPIREFVELLHNVFPGSKWSETFFRWKHLDNPLGPSILVWAVFQGRVIGFRAFWLMELRDGERKIRAYQPCDTVVALAFRGAGVFSEMTRMGRFATVQQGGDWLFNFPTNMSLGGYLKLGWKHQPDICRYLHLSNLSQVFCMSIRNRWWRQPFMTELPSSPAELEDFRSQYWNQQTGGLPSLSMTREYLTWRFLSNPKVVYGVVRANRARMVYRIGFRGPMRVAELLAWSWQDLSGLTTNLLSELVKVEQPAVISLVAPCGGPILRAGKSFFRAPSNLNFVAINLKNREKLPKILFEPALYDTV